MQENLLTKMKWCYLAFLPIILLLIPTCTGQGNTCIRRYDNSGEIFDIVDTFAAYTKCWTVAVRQGTYVRLEFTKLSLYADYDCSGTYVKIIVNETKEVYTYCPKDTDNLKPVTASSDITIKFSHHGDSHYYSSSFGLKYHIEDLICTQKNHFRCSNHLCIHQSKVCNEFEDCENGIDEIGCEDLICAQKNHFRCSNHSCIHQSKVCNGVKDCENGIDEIGCGKDVLAVIGINITRENTITWLKEQKSVSNGWGRNTHRAITALNLAQAVSFLGQNLEEELIVKQLELQAALALLRNSTDPLSVSELSMFVNALTVTCHNPRRFYGYDLLQILRERVSISKSPSPGAYLTLCNSNWTLSESDIRSLLKLLHKQSKYPFLLDVQAMTVMALTCAKNKSKEFARIANASEAYNATIEKFIAGQLSDGSFGNVYTTALVTQALIASGQENIKGWNVTSTVQYLMNQVNSSSIDFLSAYLTLPIFNGRSHVDIKAEHCLNTSSKQDEDNEISDVRNKLGGKIRIKYSLYIGDKKDVIHSIFLTLPVNSSAYDAMRVAQVADPVFKFLHRDSSGHMYVYRIAGITNDPEAEKFWLLYTEAGTPIHHTESPDELILDYMDHLIMWYETAHI